MINHARTLLLNCRTDGPGAEYIPAEFKPRKLTPGMQAVWNVLFGHDADDAAKNYRVRQLMTILHKTDLSLYIYDMDRRITYWPADDTVLGPEPESLVPLHNLVQALTPVLEDVGPELFFGSSKLCLEDFAKLWYEDKRFVYRLGGLLLAFIYRIGELDEVEGC